MRGLNRVRVCAFGYFILFVSVVISGHIPAFNDAQGREFGLFTLDIYDDALHLASGIWAGIVGWLSYRASRGYFRLFGPLYFLDGVLGLFTGSGYLDGGIFLYGPVDLPPTIRFFANLPHLVIGGTAIWIGYRLARRDAPASL